MFHFIRSLSNLSGLILAVGCIIHCMMMPLLLASLPAWGLTWLVSPRLHQILALLGIGIGLWALLPSWRVHGRSTVILLAGSGLMIMNYAAFFGTECCQIHPNNQETNQLPECCQDSCCSTSVSEKYKNEEVVAITEKADVLVALLTFLNWLSSHPTAIGATLLAWAHCLNGLCGRACCQKESAS
ncbi:MerC family mercury resistance protein [Gimesia aquarii]|uniref:MerC family mercury resistance protein n=1 Tax=Gimesia aquarii TaxID=2527964 RepID=UPI0018D68A11|nr:MerC family mercury resistance protein [Gimesia aquarii]